MLGDYRDQTVKISSLLHPINPDIFKFWRYDRQIGQELAFRNKGLAIGGLPILMIRAIIYPDKWRRIGAKTYVPARANTRTTAPTKVVNLVTFFIGLSPSSL